MLETYLALSLAVAFGILKMKAFLKTLFDICLVLCGTILTPWALIKWSEIGFRLEGKFYAGNRDGSFFLIAILIGLGLVSYGLFNLFVLRRRVSGAKNHTE